MTQLTSPNSLSPIHHIFGHKSPDTDAICSALVLQTYFTLQKIPSHAYRLGNPNQETTYLFDRFALSLPPYLDPNRPFDTLSQGDIICLTDHNELSQSIDSLNSFNIAYVIDHHKLNLSTPTPAYIRIYPVGCTCTILLEMFIQKSLPIDQTTATLMLCAIISDTLNLTSPTTTHDDIQAVAYLQNSLSIDVNELASAMFTAKSNVTHLSATDILLMDYKEFNFGQPNKPIKWGIAGIETTDPTQIFARKDELSQAANELKTQKNLTHLMIAIVDIYNQTGYAIAYDDNQNNIITTAFNSKSQDGIFVLKNVVSRKKQLIPALENYYQNNLNFWLRQLKLFIQD